MCNAVKYTMKQKFVMNEQKIQNLNGGLK